MSYSAKAGKFKDFVKSQFGIPFLVAAFGLAIVNLVQYRKCVDNPQDIAKFKDDSLVVFFRWVSWFIIIFCIIIAIIEVAPNVMD